MAAATSLSSSSPLVDTRSPSQATSAAAASPQCVSLPTLPPPAHPFYKATAYCRKIARNVASMATTGDSPLLTREEPPPPPPAPPAPLAEVSETELPDVLKTIQEAWDKVEDKYAVSSLGLAAVVALIGASGTISAIDRLPLIPGAFELVGIGYTGWAVYRNLIFKPDREALFRKIKELYSEIIGSS